MGETVIETEAERLRREGISQGEAKMLIKIGQKEGLDDATILKRMQKVIVRDNAARKGKIYENGGWLCLQKYTKILQK